MVFHYKPSILEYHYFWKHPNIPVCLNGGKLHCFRAQVFHHLENRRPEAPQQPTQGLMSIQAQPTRGIHHPSLLSSQFAMNIHDWSETNQTHHVFFFNFFFWCTQETHNGEANSTSHRNLFELLRIGFSASLDQTSRIHTKLNGTLHAVANRVVLVIDEGRHSGQLCCHRLFFFWLASRTIKNETKLLKKLSQ